ncbi:hypothetical protein A3206_01620 [Candidatus Methanomassiliicoccus intestinalis]|uniref:CRISPR-associated endoribonuclease Cas6 n=1 Tax=Candidatus Methanomassiliicoccus intestinalis TaxID=1406512 RepID=UPI0037DDBECF|nr:MAG: hypothetical protein A3206_01620 [Candidatus Methanomassiliicoccus intestinalis]
MTIDLSFALHKNNLPKDYRPTIVSYIKYTLSKYYPKIYHDLYGTGGTIQKSFTFSVALPKAKFQSDSIELGNSRFWVTFSSSNDFDTLLLYNAFRKDMQNPYPIANGNYMALQYLKIKPVPKITENTITIRFLSPLVVRKHYAGEADKYYIFEDDEFSNCLNIVTSNRLGKDVKLDVEPISPKKTVVKSFGVNIRSSLGTYKVTSDPDVLNELLLSGMGSRRSEGFGHFEIVSR